MSNKKPSPVTPTPTAVTEVVSSDAPTLVLDAPATDAAPTAEHETALFTVPLASDSSDADTVLTQKDFVAAGMGPRTRWAAIIWGLLFATIAGGTLSLVIYPASRNDVADWLFALDPSALLLLMALAVGTLLLLSGLIGLLRRAQRARAQRQLAN